MHRASGRRTWVARICEGKGRSGRERKEGRGKEENGEEREERERKRNLGGVGFETRIFSVFWFFKKSFVLG